MPSLCLHGCVNTWRRSHLQCSHQKLALIRIPCVTQPPTRSLRELLLLSSGLSSVHITWADTTPSLQIWTVGRRRPCSVRTPSSSRANLTVLADHAAALRAVFMQPTRTRIRHKYGLEEAPYSDCMSTTLLCCFAICQEASEIEVRWVVTPAHQLELLRRRGVLAGTFMGPLTERRPAAALSGPPLLRLP